MMYRVLLFLTGGLLLLMFLTPISTTAQEWAQEAEVITTVGYDGPLHLFLESLSIALADHPDTRVRRTPQDSTYRPYHALQEELYEDGVSLPSASHAFLRYRFDLRGKGTRTVETLQDIHFILRLDAMQTDLSIIHISTEDPLVQEVLTTRGLQNGMNLHALSSFRNLMAFPILSARDEAETALVELGRRPVRGAEGVRTQQTLLRMLRDHTNAGAYTYELSTIPTLSGTVSADVAGGP